MVKDSAGMKTELHHGSWAMLPLPPGHARWPPNDCRLKWQIDVTLGHNEHLALMMLERCYTQDHRQGLSGAKVQREIHRQPLDLILQQEAPLPQPPRRHCRMKTITELCVKPDHWPALAPSPAPTCQAGRIQRPKTANGWKSSYSRWMSLLRSMHGIL